MSLEMAAQDGPAGRDSHVGPRSHLGASRDQYGVTVQVRFLTVLEKDRTSPYLYGTAVRYGQNFSNTPFAYKPECNAPPVLTSATTHLQLYVLAGPI